MENVQKKYQSLCELISKYNVAYYVNSAPLISDADFDVLYRELLSIEAAHPELVTPASPTQHVGSDLGATGTTINHIIPMLSLFKVHTSEELKAFDDRLREDYGELIDYVVEPKYDGLSLSLIYKQGVLCKAVTRGNGVCGRDVTTNARMIKSIPKDITKELCSKACGLGIPDVLEVRGEVLMTYAAFENLNKQYKSNGRKEYCDPRSAASGILLGSSSTACQMLTFMAFNMYCHDKGREFMTHNVLLANARLLGFKDGGVFYAANIAAAKEHVGYIESIRTTLKYPIDGAVIKVAQRQLWSTIGATQSNPKWAVAYKFKTDEYITTFRGIRWDVSDNTGRLTPVALYDEVVINGKRCKSANISSYNHFIDTLGGIREGDKVVITLANEIVPKLLRWYSVGGNGKAATTAVVCPLCGSNVRVEGAHCYCVRPDKHAAARAAKDKPQAVAIPDKVSQCALYGMSVVVSGQFTKRYTREQVEGLVSKAGGKLTSSISSKTAFMVAGDVKPGWSKLEKCEKLGVPVISEDDFLRRILK